MEPTKEDLLRRAAEEPLVWHPDGSRGYTTTFESVKLEIRLGERDFYESPMFEVFSEGVCLGGFDHWPWKWRIPGFGGFLKRLLWNEVVPRS